MKREDLFLAIGQVENSRLVRSEVAVSTRKNIRKRFLTLLAAALALTTLAVTAYAVGAYVIYDTPEEMLSSIFGNKTGHDSGEYTEIPDPERPGSLLGVLPEYERVEADPTVVQEDIAPYVSPVGQSIQYQGMTLTVDAFVYDSATQCGVVTYTLENGPAYELQYDGSLWYNSTVEPVYFNQYGCSYIIQDKCSAGKLAAAYYFHYNPYYTEGEFSVTLTVGQTHEERMAVYERCMEQVKAAYTPEQALEEVKTILGENYENYMVSNPEYCDQTEEAYKILRDQAVMEYKQKNRTEPCQEKILFDCSESREMDHLTAGDGSVTIGPMSMVVDMATLTFLHEEGKPANSDLIDSVAVCFADGETYVVLDENREIYNAVYALNTSTDGNVRAVYTVRVMMFNRIIDLDKVESVLVNGTELKTD